MTGVFTTTSTLLQLEIAASMAMGGGAAGDEKSFYSCTGGSKA